MEALDADYQRLLMQLVASWVLISVFALSAIAFIATIFGLLKPDKTTRNYLFGVFSITAVSLLVGVALDFLRVDPAEAAEKISIDSERQATARVVQAINDNERAITVYTQIASEKQHAKYVDVRDALDGTRFVVTAVEVVGDTFPASEIRYCNPINQVDANMAASLIQKAVGSRLPVKKISKCDVEKNRNIVEVWLR